MGHGHGLLVSYRFHLVHKVQIQVLGHEARADTLNLVGCRFGLLPVHYLGDDRRIGWLDGDGGNVLAPGALDVTGDAGQRAARADTGHENVDFAVGVVPDLRAGGVFMNARVGRVLELLRQEVVVRIGGKDFFRLGDGARHALRGLCEHQFSPQGFQNFPSLQAHGGGHGQNQFVAPGGGHKGQGDTGVAAGGLDNGHAGLQGAALLAVPNHRSANPAFDGIGRVAAFDLGPDGRPVIDAVQLDQRGIADGE